MKRVQLNVTTTGVDGSALGTATTEEIIIW